MVVNLVEFNKSCKAFGEDHANVPSFVAVLASSLDKRFFFTTKNKGRPAISGRWAHKPSHGCLRSAGKEKFLGEQLPRKHTERGATYVHALTVAASLSRGYLEFWARMSLGSSHTRRPLLVFERPCLQLPVLDVAEVHSYRFLLCFHWLDRQHARD